ncbi:MAG TPA: excinuclease ABC subunit UvrB [Verrucomicrobiae bacterium]|nr:excinuclease ABC subunit UvrB [Verrucomicrobiae bacterium]
MEFSLEAPYEPKGDQPGAIEALARGVAGGKRAQVLLGVTGSGKTFTMANLIARLGCPTLVLSHNKTLAAQLYSEFKQFFPRNAVEYFVSYFDYYQPEAYIPRTDTYIEKDSSINDEIERLRLSATASLLSRRDVVVVASVSCIYGLGSPEDFASMLLPLEVGASMARDAVLSRLVDMQYDRNDIALERGRFRVRGDVVEVWPAGGEEAVRLEFFGDEIERMARFDPLTGDVIERLERHTFAPAKQFVTPHDKIRRALVTIREELDARVADLEAKGKLVEAQRVRMRTEYDLEMIEEMGYCSGIENYSRHLAGRPPGSRPYTLLDFFPAGFLTIIDESHATVPQLGGMYNGDIARKRVLVEHGFRLPSALDNRPLNFQEFRALVGQVLYVSATPGPYELAEAGGACVEQIIRPTGLVDPPVIVRPLKGQIDDLIARARERVARGERVLVTTLTKRTAEDLTDYLRNLGIRVMYLHSEIDAIERVEILRGLRRGACDVLVGINLLREGLDLPEVSLVAILDADKEGFLRSATSLIQTAGRAARHIGGEVVLYADTMTDSIRKLIETTKYRREAQTRYNEENGITPESVKRAEQESLHTVAAARQLEESIAGERGADFDAAAFIEELEREMREASENLEYEKAALLRDQIREVRGADGGPAAGVAPAARAQKYRMKRSAGPAGRRRPGKR